MRRLAIVWILLILTITACGSNASDSGKADPIILTSSTILADITRHIAGDRQIVESLLPIGADPHSYQPTPRDASMIVNSPLIIINGLGYESSLQPLLDNISDGKKIVEVSSSISPRKDAGDTQSVDPHVWLDPNLVILQVENIRIALTQYDPQGEATYQTNADEYVRQLTQLDVWITQQVSQIPVNQRLLITNHEAMGYFAERYGFSIAGSVLASFSTDASPSAQQIAALIDATKASGARAIFVDTADNPELAKQIADEAGVRVVDNLHLESLTDGDPAETYIDLMKYDVLQIVNALK